MNINGHEIKPFAILWGADLKGANLQGANLQGADLYGADLEGANLQGADLNGVDLEGASLRGANLKNADLWGANLKRANLQGADLEGANLAYANLEGANLVGANVKGTILEEKEEPKKVGYELPKDFKEQLKELRDTSTIPITKFTTYDIDSINDSFLQIAEKIKNKEAQVCTMNMEIDQQTHTQRITFDVLTNF